MDTLSFPISYCFITKFESVALIILMFTPAIPSTTILVN